MCNTRKTWFLLWLAFGIVLMWAFPATAAPRTTYYYDATTNNTNDPAYKIVSVVSMDASSNIDANTTGHRSLREASLFDSNFGAVDPNTGGIWSPGDTVYLRAGKVFRADPPASDQGLILLDANTDGTPSVGWDANSNWFTLDLAGGEIWYHAASASGDVAAVRIAESGYAVMNGKIRTTDANGGRVFVVGGLSDGSQGSIMFNNIQDFLIRDIVGVALPYSGSSPTAIRQDVTTNGTAGEYNITGRVERFTFENGLGFRDILSTGGASTTITPGYVEFVDCRVGGATSTGGAGNGTSNGCLSADASLVHVVYGGVYHDAGGSCIEQVDATTSPQAVVYVFGAEVYGSQYRQNFDNGGSGYSSSAGGIAAAWVENSYVHNCPTGIILKANDATSAASTDEYDIATVRGTLILADPVEGRVDGDINTTGGSQPGGIIVEAANARIENSDIFDFDFVDVSTAGEYQVSIRQTNLNRSLTVRNVWIKNMFRGIQAFSAQDSGLVVDDCLFTGVLRSQDSTGFGSQYAAAVWFGSVTNRVTGLLRNNIFALDPDGIATGGFLVVGNSVNGVQSNASRGNYFWCADDNTNGIPDCGTNGTLSGFFGYWPDRVADDATTNATTCHFGRNTQPILDDYGRLVASAIDSNTDGTPEASPGLTTGFSSPIPRASWAGNRIATGAAGTVTNAGQFITTLPSVVADFYNGQTLYCTAATTAGNVGEYRRIVDYATNGEIFVEPRFSGTVTATTDTFVVLPPMDPPWGDLALNKLGVLRFEMQTERRDIFGRYPLPTSPSVLPRGQITGRRVGGPNKLRRVTTDHRWRGQLPLPSGAEKSNVQAVLPDPGGQPGGGFGTPLGQFRTQGVN